MATDVVSSPVEAGLTLFLVQVFIILILVVIGEILAGVLLGPSLFGQIPGFSETIFPPASLPLLKLISSVALIFFMCFLGMELEVSLMLRTWKSTAPTAVVAFFVSFFVGIIVAPLLATVDSEVDAADVGTVYRLFVGMSFAFSAFPVLARVLSNQKLLPTTLGIQSLSCAAVDDIVDWVVLALSLSYAAHGTVSGGLYTALIFICFVLGSFLLLQPALAYVHRRLMERDDELNTNFIALIFLCLLVMCWMTQVIGVQAFFGAFICGVIVPREGKIARELSDKIEFLIVEFFLPLYFAYSGLFTDITKLNTVQSWIMVLVMSGFASAAKVLTCCLMTRLASGRFGWEEGQRTLEQIYNDSHKDARGGSDATTAAAPSNAREHRLGSLLDSGVPSSDSADAEIVEHFVVGNAHGPLRSSHTMESAQSVDGSPVAAPFETQPLQYNASVMSAQTSSPLYDQRAGVNADSGAPSIVVDSSSSSDELPRPPSPSFFVHTPGQHAVTDWFGLKRYEPAPWDACWALGLLMNTRGLVALIVLNVALENGYLSITSFTILLLMALFTTFLTSPLLFVFYTRTWNKGLEEAEAEAEAEAMAREFMKPLENAAEAGGASGAKLPKMVRPLPMHEWKQPFEQLVSLHCIPVLPRASRSGAAKDPFFLGASTAQQRPASPPSVAKWMGGAEQAPTEWQGPAEGYEQKQEEEEEQKIASPSQQRISANQVRFHIGASGGDDSLSPASRAPPASARSAMHGSASASQSWNRSTPTAADLSSRSGGSRFVPRDRTPLSRGVDRLLTGLFPASKPFGSSPALARQQSAAAAAAEMDASAAADDASSSALPAMLSPTHARRASTAQLLPSLDPRSLQIPHAAQLEEAAKMRRHVRKRMQDKANMQRGQNRQQQQQGAGSSSGGPRED